MNGAIKKTDTLQAWSDIVIKIWREKIVALKVWDSGDLYKSFVNTVRVQSGGDRTKINHMFSQYGIYADMGVGKELYRGNSGQIGKGVVRAPKMWFSRVWYREVMRLRELIAERYSGESVYSMMGGMSGSFDQRYSSPATEGRTVSSLRTEAYRDQQSERNMRNYRRRRAWDGVWSGGKTYKPIVYLNNDLLGRDKMRVGLGSKYREPKFDGDLAKEIRGL